MTTPSVTEKQLERARGEGEGARSLRIEVSDEFLRRVNAESGIRGMSNRDFVIESIIRNLQEEF